MSWTPLDPFKGESVMADDEPVPTGQELVDVVAYYKRQATRNGEPHDPEWDRWIREDQGLTNGAAGLAEAQRRYR